MTVEDRIRASLGGAAGAYVELAKPGITFFVAVTAAAGYLVAAPGAVAASGLLHLLLGVVLSTAGALALNQYLERGPDALMIRTQGRPVPSGRIPPRRAAVFGGLLLVAGVGHLWFWLGWLPALLTAASAVLYDAVYTPLKLRSPVATPVGAVPGALPALIGWTAQAGTVDGRGITLFGILFLWQLIHVLALGWNLRDDYERAGFQIIPPGPPRIISGLMVGYAVALLALSAVPALLGMAGLLYLAGAALLGAAMVAATVSFLLRPTRRRCNRVFVGSLLYHPALLVLMVAGAVPGAAAVPAAAFARMDAPPREDPMALQEPRPRARDLGIEVGVFAPGPHNAITDVRGVLVGHATIRRGDDVRTGVTAIRPHGGNVYFERVPAALHVGNGFGKLVGATQVAELGELETPILLTCTLCVWKAADAMAEWALAMEGMERVRSINPVVGETNDGGLNDIRSRPVEAAHVRAALDGAAAGPVEEGSVGAGTGTSAFGWKGGIGTSSRVLPGSLGGWAVGVLVQSNFGGILTIAGVPVGRELGRYSFRQQVEGAGRDGPGGADDARGADVGEADDAQDDGSIMIVVATDAPLSERNLGRAAARAIMGLSRTGSFAGNGSGDYVIAFSTAPGARRRPGEAVRTVEDLANDNMSAIFQAVVEATEEAIYNSMFKAVSVSSRWGSREQLPIAETVEVLRRHGAVRE